VTSDRQDGPAALTYASWHFIRRGPL